MPRTGLAVVRNVEGAMRAAAVTSAGSAASDEGALVKAVARGEPEAFRQLLERHLASVTAIARRMLRDDAEAEDVAQEAFLRLWRTGSNLDIGPGGIKPWLRRVVSNLCIDRIRGSARQTVVEDVPEQAEEPGQLLGIENAELSARVDRALKELPERQRMALTLFHFEGMSQNEVAAAMDISAEAVESLLSRARRALKASLKDEWTALKDS